MSILNPYVLLALILTFLASNFVSYERGNTSGEALVRAAWEHADKVVVEARAKRAEENRKISEDLQSSANEDRRKQNAERDRIVTGLLADLDSLRKRAYRPTGPAVSAVPTPAGPGPAVACTGAGLYRDDAELLTRRAAAYQLIRLERDACYKRYGEAQKALAGARQ